LQAFQFVVFLEVDRPEIVYEAYTFSINYQTLLDGTILGVDGMSVGNITSFGKETNEQYDFSLPESRKTLQIIMRRLIAMTQNLDALPGSFASSFLCVGADTLVKYRSQIPYCPSLPYKEYTSRLLSSYV